MSISQTRPLMSLKNSQGTVLSTHRYQYQAEAAALSAGPGVYTLERPNISIGLNDSVAVDTTPPVITLNGSVTLFLNTGDTYNELGATANDETDGPVSVVITGTVDVNSAGVYVLTYTATDSSGNVGSAQRTITIADVPAGSDTVYVSSLTVPPESLLYGLTFEVGDQITYNLATTNDAGANGSVSIDTLGVVTVTGPYGTYDITATWTNQTTGIPVAL